MNCKNKLKLIQNKLNITQKPIKTLKYLPLYIAPVTTKRKERSKSVVILWMYGWCSLSRTEMNGWR